MMVDMLSNKIFNGCMNVYEILQMYINSLKKKY